MAKIRVYVGADNYIDLSSIETLPTNFSDRLNPFDGYEILGGYGNDIVNGSRFNDYIFGDRGNDILNGGRGNDEIEGGDGNDEVYGGEGNDTLFGNMGDDFLYGNNGNDTLSGSYGTDQLYGGAGNDKLNGGNGNDILRGEANDDILDGGTGNDLLVGGQGNDTLTGGTGSDTFIFLLAEPAGIFDRITDFAAIGAVQDVIELQTVLDNQTSFTGTTSQQAISQGYIYFIQHGTAGQSGFGTQVMIDLNGGAHSATDAVLADLANVAANQLNATHFLV